MHLSITQIMLADAPVERRRGDELIEQHVHARLHFQISASPTKRAAEQPTCFVQLLAYELSTGRTVVLATDRQQLRSDQVEYTASLTFAMPQAGRYQLAGMVLIPEAGALEVAFGPALRVMP